LRGVDAISAWSLPALQSASLRSYVLALVMTAAVLLAGALLAAGLPDWAGVINVQPHEAAAALGVRAVLRLGRREDRNA
jgi:hypothetical protein